jgi:arsenite methyltransferase
MDAKDIYQHVQERYAAVASGISDEKYGRNVAKAFGYTEEELASIPQEANMGVSCGNPLALAHLREVRFSYIHMSILIDIYPQDMADG